MPIDPTIEAMLAAAPPWPPTRTQSIQQLRDAVRASALAFPVLPGGVYTSMGNPNGLSVEQINMGFGSAALQRVGMPAEIAQASVFLASDQASYICGTELVVDGGWTTGIYHAHFPGAPGDQTYGE